MLTRSLHAITRSHPIADYKTFFGLLDSSTWAHSR